MILKNNEFKKGYQKLVAEEDESMKMDFGLLGLDKGDSYKFCEPKECIYTLLKGEVTFKFEGKEEKASRNSCFHDCPTVLHVPENIEVEIIGESDSVEVTVQCTKNSKKFDATLYREQNLLCANETRGFGTMNDASARIVRTFFDRNTCPETNFYVGESVMYPGKWSSYPPHFHIEPEIYFYKFLPENGYGFAEMGEDAYKIKNNDLTGMPENLTHSQVSAAGYAQYYYWVIRLQDDVNLVSNIAEEHQWLTKKDAKYFPEI